ncbi:MAG: 23S rRNA (guanosine(2251)-2'-O)-methyltransferase RlmB [Pseudomonadota bacterium]
MAYDKPRTPRAGGPRSSAPRSSAGKSYGDKPAYGPRKSYGDKPAYAPRSAEGGERPRRAYGSNSGERPAYAPRADGERRPYTPRAEGERRPYTPRAEGERRPYTPRAEGGERPRRAYGDKPSYGPRAEGERRPYTPRPAYNREERPAPVKEWGDAKKPRFAEKPNRKAQFERKKEPETPMLANGDGWLVGNHAVLAALKNGRRKVREVWLLAEASGDLAQVLAANPEWPVQVKAREDFNREFAEAVHQGVAALVGNLQQPSLPELLAQKPNLLVALDQVTDPHNLGAIVRSCAAFGVQGVLVTEHRAAGVNATAAKAAAGALESVPVAEITNLAQALKMLDEAGYVSIGLAGEAEAELGEILTKLKPTDKVCLVVGSEGEGLRRLTRENCTHLAKINIASTVESLNVSVATGVALALLSRR